jgi:hydroxypyruvate reductase
MATASALDASARRSLRMIFDSAVARADPGRCLAQHLPEKPCGRCIVVGAGKAAASMAAALESAWPEVSLTGLVVTRHGHAVPTRRIEVLEAGHPVPDRASEVAASRILAAVSGLDRDDLVLALISGGGSATLALPAEGLTLADKQHITRSLLRSGAAIEEMNLVRQYLSAIKGGRLAAAAAPARVVTLAISDVPGDSPALIASGPTVHSPPNHAGVLDILSRYRIELPPAVAAFLARSAPTHTALATADFRLIATPLMALQAAAHTAQSLRYNALILGDALEGESSELGITLAGVAKSVRQNALPATPPAVLLSGGETTVTVGDGAAGRRVGQGGRNTEFLLSLAIALRGTANIWALAGDSDGIDGSSDAAGAIITPDTLARAAALGLDAQAMLGGHDSYTLFNRLGDLVKTGPTHTNVNDIRLILIAS